DFPVLVQRIVGVTPGFTWRDTTQQRPAAGLPRQVNERQQITGIGFAIDKDDATGTAELLINQTEKKRRLPPAGPADDDTVRKRGFRIKHDGELLIPGVTEDERRWIHDTSSTGGRGINCAVWRRRCDQRRSVKIPKNRKVTANRGGSHNSSGKMA